MIWLWLFWILQLLHYRIISIWWKLIIVIIITVDITMLIFIIHLIGIALVIIIGIGGITIHSYNYQINSCDWNNGLNEFTAYIIELYQLLLVLSPCYLVNAVNNFLGNMYQSQLALGYEVSSAQVVIWKVPYHPLYHRCIDWWIWSLCICVVQYPYQV